MAEFIYLYHNTPQERDAAMGSPEAAQRNMTRWMEWMRGLEQGGHLKSAGQPLEKGGKVVRGGSGKGIITDGPFVEIKDVVGGYSIIEAKDLAEAAELAKGCPALDGPNGAVEVRPVMKMDF
ncbi:MAG TPA: YciI family protein [Gemmatimonadales bacterium]